jgi:hypothetical protein
MTAEAAPADYGWREGFDATLQHLELLKRKEDRLRAARVDAEAQLIHTLAGAYAAGLIDIADLCKPYLNKRGGR